MHITRRTFLASASAAVLAPVLGSLSGCSTAARVECTDAATATAPRRSIFRPPPGKVLFIAGQGGAQVGGRPDLGCGDGYLDHMPLAPGGFTMYCNVDHPVDLNGLTRYCSTPALRESMLHLSVGWVADFDKRTQRNNQAITTGEFDANIDGLARWCAAQPRPILLRIGYEFDRGVPFPNYHYDPAYFAEGFRRIVDRFRAAGATNVASVLASTNASPYSPSLTVEKFNQFYPGDDYVDWLGCSMWWPDGIDHVILSESRKRNKPVLLAETTPMKWNIGKGLYYPNYLLHSETRTAQQIWDGWHQPMIDFIKANSDVIAAWHYIAADWSKDDQWKWAFTFTNCDARPWASPEFLAIWNERMTQPPFIHASAGLFEQLAYRRE